jgi:1,2-diacylglycerol 3-beta-galactosyltransferase
MKGMHGVIRLLHGKQVRMLENYWRDRKPDMLVSLIPNFNRALWEAARRVMPSVPMVTILTDMADYPPHFWIERQKQYFICGTEHARDQALQMGHSPDRVFLTSGMILNPRFYEMEKVDRHAEREALGLDPLKPTAMIMFGGEGSRAMLPMARQLDASGLDLQIIAICGKNHKLEAAMREMPRRIKMHVFGFTREVPKLMQLSDFFIGKPGPGSISEAVAMGLPVIIERNHWTLPQERYNADWVREQGVGIAVRRFKTEIVEATRQMLDPEHRFEFLKRVSKQKNRAVFEIPQILERILTCHPRTSA